jgi:hypothetical protein
MKKLITLCLVLFGVFTCAAEGRGQGNTQATKSAQPAVRRDDTQRKNIQAYVELIRKDVRRDKTQIMGAVMRLDPEDAAKFWPIYNEYDAELNKVNNLRSDNIQEYARTYAEMTDEKADELIKRALDYQRQRSDLLGRYYERVKEALDAINAARFVQIEHQLLMLIDLQIASSLPVVGQR